MAVCFSSTFFNRKNDLTRFMVWVTDREELERWGGACGETCHLGGEVDWGMGGTVSLFLLDKRVSIQ